MNFYSYKKYFLDRLKPEHSQTEAESFFNLLAEEYVGMTRLEIALNLPAGKAGPKKELNGQQKEDFEGALKRLLKHEPIQYILGKTEFYGLEFKVNPHVLIPRPETEELISWIQHSAFSIQHSALRILDIGTGSGCIAVSLAKNLPDAKVFALDVSEKALKIAKENAERNKVKIDFFLADILKMDELPQKFDLIVSNPPYVRESEKKEMHRNVLEHEPETALYVKDDDALLFYRKIATLANEKLNRGGEVYVEVNQYLGRETEKLFLQNGFSTELRKDLFGNERMLRACLS